MPNPNAIVSTIIGFDPPLDRPPAELLRGPRGLSVELEEGRRVRLDPANPRSAGLAQILDGLSKLRRPVYLEVDPETSAITRLFIPHVSRVIGIRHIDRGVLGVELDLSHGRHVLRQSMPDFAELERQLREALRSGAPVIVTENDAHEIIPRHAVHSPGRAPAHEEGVSNQIRQRQPPTFRPFATSSTTRSQRKSPSIQDLVLARRPHYLSVAVILPEESGDGRRGPMRFGAYRSGRERYGPRVRPVADSAERPPHPFPKPPSQGRREGVMRKDRRPGPLMSVICVVVAVLLFVPTVHAQGKVTLSRDMLETMAKSAVVSLEGLAGAASDVHVLLTSKPSNDCEFHFRFTPSGQIWRGAPYPHYVAEPPNACLYDENGTYNDDQGSLAKRWRTWTEALEGKTVTVEGVPRIWFEHTKGQEHPSNPHHVLELHPVTVIDILGDQPKSIRAVKWIHDIPSFKGIKTSTVQSIFENGDVRARRIGGNQIEVSYEGRLGNFARLDVQFDLTSAKKLNKGYRMRGRVANVSGYAASFLAIEGTNIYDELETRLKHQHKTARIKVLGLISIDPVSVLAAASQAGSKVTRPYQFVLFGEEGDYGEAGED